jgi:hypothetical protein
MTNTNFTAITEIQNLIRANYERMVAFEQASFNVTDQTLKTYFEAKADESEMNIVELNEVLSSLSGEKFEVEESSEQNMLGASHLFTGQKNVNVVLKNILFLERSIIGWYKAGIKNLKGISQGFNDILNKHSVGLEASHVYVKSC